MNILLNAGFAEPGLVLSRLAGAEAGPDMFSALVDLLAHGVILLDERGKLLHANPAAHLELTRGRVLNQARDELRASTPADGRQLQGALARAQAGKRSLINLGAAGVNMTLAVVPLNPDAVAWKRRTAILLSRADVGQSGMFVFFARNHGLTQTEEQVLAVLCRGLSTPEIAREMKVAVSTVRSHVRSLCGKTGSSGVRELVNRVAVLAPVASCHQGPTH